MAQISINFTNFNKTPIHEVFDTVCDLAEKGELELQEVLVGLVPLNALMMAGTYYLKNSILQ